MTRTTALVAACTTLVSALAAHSAAASSQLLSEAKKQGLPAKNCQYCHISPLPKMNSFRPDDMNERGQWLVSEKGKQKAKSINVEWLKQYPGGPEQK